ncbi:MAG TPA: urease accessory protein UreE [Candidatus Sulfotelmatobacter sp.]|nr:urease accessory protein UreE [Candidatus Sulfotelmatobacter sp.]
MLTVERISPRLSDGERASKERDHLSMTSEERRWVRRRALSARGRSVALALPTGTVLHPGDILANELRWYLEIEAAEEPVFAVRPRDYQAALRVAFEVGNHHFPLAIEGEKLLVPDDTAMLQLLNRLGEPWERIRAVFDPIAKGHRHES